MPTDDLAQPLRAITGLELIERVERHRRETLERGRWGNWYLDRDRLVLEFRRDGRWLYEISLERCRTAAEVADWIFQLNAKTWTSSEDIGDLVEALDFIIDPHLCSWGSASADTRT